jgi:hypothetical protein
LQDRIRKGQEKFYNFLKLASFPKKTIAKKKLDISYEIPKIISIIANVRSFFCLTQAERSVSIQT